MTRARAIFTSLRLAGTILSAHPPASSRRLLTRLTRPCLIYDQLLPICLLGGKSCGNFRFFSTNPTSVLELLLSNDWSDELKNELEKLRPVLSHEYVVFIVKKLDEEPQKALTFFNWVCGRDGFKPSSILYSLVLRVLVSKGLMKEFWVTLRKMKEQGFYLDEETRLTIVGILKKVKLESDTVALNHFYQRMIEENGRNEVVKRVVSAVMERQWGPEVDRELTEMKILLSDNLVIRVLKELRNHPLKALRFFNWVDSCPDYKHSTVTYNAAARVLGRDDSIEEFWSVVEKMKSEGHDMDLDTYIKISRQFQKWKMMRDAVKLYEFMMDGPYKPSVQDCNYLLRALSSSNEPDLDLVFRVVRKYESTGHHSLSKAVYDGIHRCLTAAGRFDQAEDIMKDMRNAGHEPDNITYSQLIFGLCKARRLDEACKVVEEMERHGCVPDIKTWTILIQGHCDCNEVGGALVQFAKVIERNLDVDADLAEVLVNGFLSQNKSNGAFEFIREMVDKARLRPWQATYKSLIDQLLGEKKVEEAMELLHLMKKQNYPPHSEPFVRYISKFGTVNDASEFLKALSVKEYPSVSTYFHILESFFKEGRHSEAKDLLYGCPPHIRQHPRVSQLFGSAKSSAVSV